MKPYKHACCTVTVFGGVPEDYIDIHNFMDVSKSSHADVRHRAVFHNALGCYVAERLFGLPLERLDGLAERFGWTDEEKHAVLELVRESKTDGCTSIVNSAGRRVQVRDVAEEHVKQDLGRIPSLSNWLDNMQLQQWMGGPQRKRDLRGKVAYDDFD